MAELRECPCCGGPGKLKDTHGKIRQGWVGCPVCGLYINWKISPDGAIKKWNTRAATPREAAYIRRLMSCHGPLLEAKGALDQLFQAIVIFDRSMIPAGGASPAPTKGTGAVCDE